MLKEPLKNLLFSIVSLTNAQNIATRFLKPKVFLPSIFVPRLAYGAQISNEEAAQILNAAPSLESKAWTAYWKNEGQKFEALENFRAATMCYILGCFPKEDTPWKDEINRLKRKSFQAWCAHSKTPVEEKIIQTPRGWVRYYLCKPPAMGKIPLVIFLNGLEGSAEEFAFPFRHYLDKAVGFAALSVPGTADYEFEMRTDSDQLLRYVIDDICAQSWVDSTKLGMVGFSFGAYWTLICAKTDLRIKFSILNGVPYRHTFHLKKSWGLNPIVAYALLCMFRLKHPLQLLGKIRELKKRAGALLNAKSGPILVMNGDHDTIVDPRDTQIIGSASNHKLLWIHRDDHCALFHYSRLVSVIVTWTDRCLKALVKGSRIEKI